MKPQSSNNRQPFAECDKPNALHITAYLHCSLCIAELLKLRELKIGEPVSPQEYQRIQAGFTRWGLQVWCTRHNANIVHIDFQGAQHPADTTTQPPAELPAPAPPHASGLDCEQPGFYAVFSDGMSEWGQVRVSERVGDARAAVRDAIGVTVPGESHRLFPFYERRYTVRFYSHRVADVRSTKRLTAFCQQMFAQHVERMKYYADVDKAQEAAADDAQKTQ